VACSALAFSATFLARNFGGPAMIYALLLGAVFHPLSNRPNYSGGVAFAARPLLQTGVALLGAQIAWGDLKGLGFGTLAAIPIGVLLSVSLGYLVARLLRLPPAFSALSAAAVSICGASAALAVATVLPKTDKSERNALMVVAGVTTLSTVAMVLYPMIAAGLQLGDTSAGVLMGATIHDVAQVVGAGYVISPEAGETATMVKLVRVVCLLPTVVIISLIVRRRVPEIAGGEGTMRPPLVPRFLLGFVLLLVLNSFGLLGEQLTDVLSGVSRAFLVTAVAALGVKTSLGALRAVGPVPLIALLAQTVIILLLGLLGVSLLGGLVPFSG
jgi:uncharacterized integral membrane protein (TIGR00698 family)